MRTFLLYARKARTDGNFDIHKLAREGGRLDIVARCLQASLYLSRGIRRYAALFAVLNGPPNPPKTIWFKGSEFKGVAIDEISIARCLKKALLFNIGKSKKWSLVSDGVYISCRSFQEMIAEAAEMAKQIYILHEKGVDIRNVRLSREAFFVLGDHLGLPLKEEGFCERYGALKVSVGARSYLASQCITLINAELDRCYDYD
ncbi:MAG: tRNA (pseudouridine(54)-N(1))-methyltransferase TrmY [Methanocellales archaeon]